MRRRASATLVIILVSGCSTSGGGGNCDGPELTAQTSASSRALSCVENVLVNGIQYNVACAEVPSGRLGAELAAGEGYVARSITKLAVSDVIAVGRTEEDGSLEEGRCGGWMISPSSQLDQREAKGLLKRAASGGAQFA